MSRAMLAVLTMAIMVICAPTARAETCASLLVIAGAGTAGMFDDECTQKRDFDIAVRGNRRNFRIYEASRFLLSGERWYLDVAEDAVERSVAFYGRHLDVPSTTIVFGSGRTRDGRGLLLGETAPKLFVDRCVVALADGMFEGRASTPDNRREIQLTVAHELFHCVQYINWPRKSQGSIFSNAEWWMEGTAEYFSHAVYAEHAPPSNRASLFDAGIGRGGLLRLAHANIVFFSYYAAHHGGPEGVIRFITRMSEALGEEAQRVAVAGVPGINEAFQDFALKYFDRDLRSPGGHAFSVSPPTSAPVAITSPGSRTLRVRPWVIQPARFSFERGQDWRITQGTADGNAQFRARNDPARGSSWSGPPVTVHACASSPVLLLAATATNPGAGENALELRFERTAPAAAAVTACQCPLGTWHMGTELLRATPWNSIGDAALVSGGITLTFQPGGTARATFNSITYEARIDRYSSIRTVLNGTIDWSWERKPWSAAQTGRPQPTGPAIDAFALHRKQRAVNAFWEVSFASRSGTTEPRRRPFRPDRQDVGGAHIAAAICEGGSALTLEPTGSATLPVMLPPYYGIYRQ